MEVAVVKYNAGNIYSVEHALKRLGITPRITADPEMLLKADKILFPGQGEASYTMNYLRATGLDRLIRELKQPVLGICIGQQLMCAHSEEGNVDCLGIFPTTVKRFVPTGQEKIPHMGWNTLTHIAPDPLMKNVHEEDYVYFIHSYYVPVTPYTVATTQYTCPFSASLHKNNFYATQFHPEKSATVGETILRNFLDL